MQRALYIAKKPLKIRFDLIANVVKYSSTNANSKLSLRDKYKEFTFEEIHRLSKKLSEDLCSNLNRSDLKGEKIAVLCANNYTYLISLLGIWMANGVPLGLNKLYPNHLLEYFINDSKCKLIINGSSNEPDPNHSGLESLLSKHKVVNYKLDETSFYPTVLNSSKSSPNTDSLKEIQNLLKLEENRQKEGVILYTSGTSGPPKGVVVTRSNLLSLTETITKSWEISSKDGILLALPLNHVHGLMYCLISYLYNGALIHMLPKFNAEQVWSALLDLNNGVNSFMGVPTIYVQLVDFYMKNADFRKKFSEEKIKEIFKKKIRLIVAGSASLTVKTSQEWENITGYRILERYGSTEIGLGLSNPFRESETEKRLFGAVGRPYGNTTVRIVEPNNDENSDSKHVLMESNEDGDRIIKKGQDKRLFGELQVKGSMVFKEYLNKPQQTKETFSDDGWFKTGDTVEFLEKEKAYRIIGRTSVDVIKSGGYKISALDVERAIMANDMIEEVCVMGLKDSVWGQRVLSVLVLKPNAKANFKQDEFIKWCKTRLPKYSVPTVVKVVDKIEKNQLGKVNKKELIKTYEKEAK